ncbi:aspartyl protease family protein [Ekhidna sp.]|uniref:aspartyl protease family protein n=1 Tax=Ekhidna sp. TaxID=2608089 RepID=UPI003CCC45D2
MKRLIPVITLLIISSSSCSYLKNVNLLTGGSLERKDFVQEIPFSYRKGLIIVQANINDDTTVREFIFDTGAFNSKIEKRLAEDIGLETITTKENSTAQGITETIEVTRIDSIRFGETTFYNIGAGKLEYDEKSYSPCVAKDGLIGSNLIKLAHWKIDYQNRKIYFSDKPFESVAEQSIRISFDRPVLSSTPKIKLNIENEEVSGLMFDTGFNGGLVMPASLAGAFSSSDSQRFIDRSTSGIYGSNTDTLIEKSLAVSFDSREYRIPVEFSSLGKGLIGNDLLEHFTVLIDNDDDEITLEQTNEVVVEKGRSFIPGILNDSLWVVNRISENSSSIRLGDTLRLVNGKRPGEIFTNHCDYFLNLESLLNGDSVRVKTLKNQAIHL